MNIALILSGGTGTRFGTEIPKQYIEVKGRPVITYCLEKLLTHDGIAAVQIVAAPEWRERISVYLDTCGWGNKLRGFSAPGENRQLSILSGLDDIRRYADDRDYVLVHDAARPMLSGKQISACLAAAAGHDGAVPVLPMKDTVYSSTDGRHITSLLHRNEIFAGQAPEVFRLAKYHEANRMLRPDQIARISGAAEPAAMAGMDIVLIPGDEDNFKITTKADLVRFNQMMEAGNESVDIT